MSVRFACVIAFALLIASYLASAVHAQYATSSPLLPAERQTTETPRAVAAPDYRDAYCAKWSDGCTVCQRTNANDQPTCQVIGGACQHQPVQCQAVLRSIHRVCFSYADGCNHCTNHRCTASFCPGRPIDYQCRLPRTAQFQGGDVTGHWRMISPDQRSCELILSGHVTLTASCLPLGPPIASLATTKLDDGVLRFLGSDNEELLNFETSNPDDLHGVASAQGYRLERLDPGTIEPFFWEGTWQLSAEDSITCDIFLSMRRQSRGLRANSVQIPQGVAFQSGCVSETGTFRFARGRRQNSSPDGSRRTIFVVMEPLNIPLWTSWRHEVFDLIFGDAAGHDTVFKRQDDGSTWRAEVEAGDKPLILTLKRKRG